MAALDELLRKTSRTFALSIPLLPAALRREVTVAYLLFRIADTFEDASGWDAGQRVEALQDLSGLLGEAPQTSEVGPIVSSWLSPPPADHPGYLELLAETPRVLEEFRRFDGRTRRIVSRHLRRTIAGMSDFVSRTGTGGELRLRDLGELRAYCYVVAGIVGEMLTELFLLKGAGLGSVSAYLRSRAHRFGEGLQLVNIVKDAAADRAEGRRYLPAGVMVERVFGMARTSLSHAAEYVIALQHAGAPRGLVAFNALPVRLAWATLDRVETQGAGAKLTREEVFTELSRMNRALDLGEPALVAPAARPTAETPASWS